MSQGEAKNGGAAEKKLNAAFDLVTVLGVEAPKAEEAVKFYKDVFGALEIERVASQKRKSELEQPLLQVLLQFGSAKVLVVDRFEDELKAQQNSTFHLVSDEDFKGVIKKVVADGGITDGAVVAEDDVFERRCGGVVKDKFGVVWSFVGKKAKCAAAENENNGKDNSVAVETAAVNTVIDV